MTDDRRAFARWLHAHRYADRTRRQYVRYAERAAEALRDLHDIELAEATPAVLFDWWANLSDHARNPARAALIQWYQCHGDRAGYPASDLPTLPEPDRPPRPVGETSWQSRIDASHRLGGIHHVAGYMFGYTGARFSEIQRARWDLIDLDDRWWRVIGKGGGRKGPKERDVPLHDDLARALETWRVECGSSAWVFPGLRRSASGHLSGPILRRILDEIALEATQPRIVPHVYRHTVASILAESVTDIRAVQELLGHAKLDTTQRYTKVRPERLRAAIALLPSSGAAA